MKEGRPFSDRASEGCVDCPDDQCEEATLASLGAAQSDMTRALSETSGCRCVGLRACVTDVGRACGRPTLKYLTCESPPPVISKIGECSLLEVTQRKYLSVGLK